MTKRVLIFSLNYYPFVGGAEVAVKEVTERISPGELEFHLICYRFDSTTPREERIGNVMVHRVGWGKHGVTVEGTFSRIMYLGKILYVPFAAVRAYQLHRRLRFDGAFALMSYMVFPLVLLRIVNVRIPYILNLQDGDPFERVFARWFIKPFKPLLRYGFRNASIIQVLSTHLGTWARDVGYRGRIEVVPNGTDTKHFSEPISDEERASIRQSQGLVPNTVVLVSTSRLVTKNALDDVIRALSYLPEDIVFINYGFGSDLDSLKHLVSKLGLRERVQLLDHPGLDTLPRYLHAADIFIRPSRTEGFGISFIEAMAAGLPVIATQEGGIADFLFDAKRNPDKETTGWAVDADSPKQIAAAVRNIIANPKQVAKVTETAKAMVIQKYDWNIIAADMRKLFESLLENR